MKCPACKGSLTEKNVGGTVIDICYGGCGGVWFDAKEMDAVESHGAAALHTIWRDPNKKVKLTEPRPCPRCPGQNLEREWFSEDQVVQIDRCPTCSGIWLDDGEFSAIQKETNGGKLMTPHWKVVMSVALLVPVPPEPGVDDVGESNDAMS